MQEAITWIRVNQDFRRHIVCLVHIELNPKADFRNNFG